MHGALPLEISAAVDSEGGSQQPRGREELLRFAEVSAKEGSSREEGRRGLPQEPERRAAPALNSNQTEFVGQIRTRILC
jgi:hypothetical protein